MKVTIRYFAAARAAASAETAEATVAPGTSLAELVGHLGSDNPHLAAVLTRCSYLCDGIAVRDSTATVRAGQIIDVLPPFAGG